MSQFSKEQLKMDQLATRRRYFKAASAFLDSPATKDFAEGLISRITATQDSYIALYDAVDPVDSVTIARYQEARKVCGEILIDFDGEFCKAKITALDAEIKELHNTMEKQKARDATYTGGFSSIT